MPIQRITMVDDDGTGTTGTILNNAWLQTIYGQIDTLVGPVTPWTPIDLSGGNLSFAGWVAEAVKIGSVVSWWLDGTFPTGAYHTTIIGGLPFQSSVNGGGAATFGSSLTVHIPANNNVIYLIDPAGVFITNEMLSGRTLRLQGQYRSGV